MAKPETPLQKGTRLRLEKKQALMQFLHRKPSDCAIDVQEQIDAAKARMKRDKTEKIEAVPTRPEGFQFARHEGAPMLPTPKAVISKNCKRVKSFSTKGKDWGKAGHAFSNKRLMAKQGWKKFNDEVSYAKGANY